MSQRPQEPPVAGRKRYRRRHNTWVTAVRLGLRTEGFEYRKWGHVQRCKPGDWLVERDGEIYTIDRQVFARCYRQRSPGRYEKVTAVWAEKVSEAGSVRTHEGRTDFEPGDYLLYDAAEGGQGWAMQAERFHHLYEPDEPIAPGAVGNEPGRRPGAVRRADGRRGKAPES